VRYADRQKHYAKIEKERKTKVLTFVTSDRQGMETAIAQAASIFLSIFWTS